MIVAAGISQDTTSRIAASTDLATWTVESDPAETGSDIASGICYDGSGTYVAVCGLHVLRSRDGGQTWSAHTSPFANPGAAFVDGYGTDVVWAEGLGLFVACGIAPEGSGQCVATSPDGITWTARTTPFTDGVAIGWNGSQLVVLGSDAAGHSTMTSPDGITWTVQTNPHFDPQQNTPSDVIWVPALSLWFACGAGNIDGPSGNPYNVISSPDGITWSGAFDSGPWGGALAYSPANGLIVWASGNGGSQRIFTSPDGTTWTHQPSADGFNGYLGACWSDLDGAFVAVLNGGYAVSGDGLTWVITSGGSTAGGHFTPYAVTAGDAPAVAPNAPVGICVAFGNDTHDTDTLAWTRLDDPTA